MSNEKKKKSLYKIDKQLISQITKIISTNYDILCNNKTKSIQ